MGTEPVVVVVAATEGEGGAEGTTEAAATVEAVEAAFVTGVHAGEEAARRDEIDGVSRAEFEALAARVDQLANVAGEAVVVAEVAAVVAVEAAESVAEGAGDDGAGDGEPVPPEPREAPQAPADAPPETKPKRTAYGAGAWYGARG